MRRLFHFILSHSLFIAFCAAALSFQTGQLVRIEVDFHLISFIFFGVLAGYNSYWLISRYSFSVNQSLRSLISTARYSFLVLILAFLGMLFCFTRLQFVLVNMVLSGLLFGLYLLPVMPFKQLEWIRKIGFLKTVLLAFAWTIITTLIPLQVSIGSMDPLVSLVFFSRFLFMLLLCIIFDKRDITVDKIRGLQSLATVVKPVFLHLLIVFIFAGYMGVNYFLGEYGVKYTQTVSLSLIGFISLILYFVSLQKRGYFFYYFGVDGLMFFSALFTWLVG